MKKSEINEKFEFCQKKTERIHEIQHIYSYWVSEPLTHIAGISERYNQHSVLFQVCNFEFQNLRCILKIALQLDVIVSQTAMRYWLSRTLVSMMICLYYHYIGSFFCKFRLQNQSLNSPDLSFVICNRQALHCSETSGNRVIKY